MALRLHILSIAILVMDYEEEEVGEIEASTHIQYSRRELLLNEMLEATEASRRAARLVHNIVENNPEKMFVDKDGKIVINGSLATYRVDMNGFHNKMNNPFDYSSFDQVEVHPKGILSEKFQTACVQVQMHASMPAYDLLGAYLLGLMNDEHTWLEENMTPLRRALYSMYGLRMSPLTKSLSEHLYLQHKGQFDTKNDRLTFNGTNGWKWRLSFGNPLARGFKIEYQKPRQDWWNHMFDDHSVETTDHYTMSHFFDIVEHLAQSPALLRQAAEWNTDPIFVRKVASDYPPLARDLISRIEAEDYDPSEIYSFYDEPIDSNDAIQISFLDDQIRSMILA
tara:strand:- start:11 stop:1024 length:1014 start_codon:yes stop_codon:yes gene_type:complete